ncbi:MAG TPA: hypothetical protein VE127_02970 [Solirubrobacteraceae bacterium]|jgi:membrane protein implicated in regulation of membrane protease activity|nr:hypothetical protein [Solirubrobacteraceae bacterium]
MRGEASPTPREGRQPLTREEADHRYRFMCIHIALIGLWVLVFAGVAFSVGTPVETIVYVAVLAAIYAIGAPLVLRRYWHDLDRRIGKSSH